MLQFIAMPTEIARALQSGSLDANGQLCETHVSDGAGNPCRHCLKEIPEGAAMLVLAYRPFDQLPPYAETGPVFCVRKRVNHPQAARTSQTFCGHLRTICSKGITQINVSSMAPEPSWPNHEFRK